MFLSFGRKKKLNHLSNGSGSSSSSGGDGESSIIEGKDSNSEVAERKGDELADATTTTTTTSSSLRDNPTNSKPQKAEGKDRNKREGGGKGEVEEIFKVKVDGEEVEIDSQIQLYATNDQVSRILSYTSLTIVLTVLHLLAGLSCKRFLVIFFFRKKVLETDFLNLNSSFHQFGSLR